MDTPFTSLQYRWIVRGAIFSLIVVLLMSVAVSAVSYEPTNLQAGNIESPANGTTVIAVQGFKFAGERNTKKPARLVGVGPRGSVEWVYNGSSDGIVWFYDVDPLDNGTLLITGTKPGKTIISVWDPDTETTVWSRTFDWEDTHDVDLINGDQLLVANMDSTGAAVENIPTTGHTSTISTKLMRDVTSHP
jgi:hypothetical protein